MQLPRRFGRMADSPGANPRGGWPSPVAADRRRPGEVRLKLARETGLRSPPAAWLRSALRNFGPELGFL
jgi:hypothetical protein